jgi:hypothetical protein
MRPTHPTKGPSGLLAEPPLRTNRDPRPIARMMINATAATIHILPFDKGPASSTRAAICCGDPVCAAPKELFLDRLFLDDLGLLRVMVLVTRAMIRSFKNPHPPLWHRADLWVGFVARDALGMSALPGEQPGSVPGNEPSRRAVSGNRWLYLPATRVRMAAINWVVV